MRFRRTVGAFSRGLFVAGAHAAKREILVAKAEGVCVFSLDPSRSAMRIAGIADMIDSSIAGGRSTKASKGVRVPADQPLGSLAGVSTKSFRRHR